MPTDFDFSDLVFPALGAAAALATPYHQGSSAGLISIINLLAHERNLREAREARGHEKELALEKQKQEQANKFFSGAPYFQDVTTETLLNQPEVQATQEEALTKAGEIPRPQLEGAFPSLRRPTERAELDVSRPTTLPLPPSIATLHERIPLLEEASRAEQEAAKEQRLPLKGGFYQGSADKQIAEELGQAYDEREALGLRPGEQAVPQVTPGVPPLTSRIQPPLLPAIDQAVESFLESTRAIPAPQYKREVVTVDPLGRRYPPHVAQALRAESIPTDQKLAFLTQIGALRPEGFQEEIGKLHQTDELLAQRGVPSTHQARQAIQRRLTQIGVDKPKDTQASEADRLAFALSGGTYQTIEEAIKRGDRALVEQVDARIQAKQIEQREAGVLTTEKIRQQFEQNKPLDEDARFWLDQNGNPADPAMSRTQARARGYVRVTNRDLDTIQNAKSALAQLDEYRDLAERLMPRLTGMPFANFLKVQGNRVLLAFLEQSGDPDAQRLEGMFGAIAIIAHATGDTANIAVEERKFLREFTVTSRDSFESATAKLDQAERILRKVVASRNVPLAPPLHPGAAPRSQSQVLPLPPLADAFRELMNQPGMTEDKAFETLDSRGYREGSSRAR